MLTERLRTRCPNAVPLSKATAPGYRLCFSKRGKDSSGKATLTKSERTLDEAYGVIFEIPRNELCKLDKAEGKGHGYDRDDKFRVIRESNEIITSTYLASENAIDKALRPYDWYHALVFAGALQHELPESYVELLGESDVTPDPNLNRKERLNALRILKCSGFEALVGKCLG